MTNKTTATAFKQIRARGVPICGIESADPAATIKGCLAALNGKANDFPITRWDIIRGLTPINVAGKEFIDSLCSGQDPRMVTGNPAECLGALERCADDPAKKLIVFWHNAHRMIDNADVSQGIWNLRDKFKTLGATFVLLAPVLRLPAELKEDIMIISEPLPDEEELTGIVNRLLESADVAGKMPADKMPLAVDTLRGLSAFAAEQCVAVSMSADTGINLDTLWDRKRKMIEQTPGLQVWKGSESFDSLGGLANVKQFLSCILTSGKTPVRAIGFIDEIEKGLAGAAGDTSGTSQDQLQVFLKVMQDLDIPGIILIGPPGTGKSAIAKAAGAVAACPVISIDTGSMKGSLVGESEMKIRTAMEVFKAVSQGKGLFIATCNKIASLPPELRRRFTLGTFFVDLPSKEERDAIWPIWLKRYSMPVKSNLPDCEGWTGAEIRACCDVAYRTGLDLVAASKFVVPVIKSAPDAINGLRQQASGRFLSASYPGLYSDPKAPSNQSAVARKLEI